MNQAGALAEVPDRLRRSSESHWMMKYSIGIVISRQFPVAASKVAFPPDLGPIAKPNDHVDDRYLCLITKSDLISLAKVLRRRLPATWRTSNHPLAGMVMFFAVSRQSSALQRRR